MKKSVIVFVVLFIVSIICIFMSDLIFPQPELGIYPSFDNNDLVFSDSREGTNPSANLTLYYFFDFNCGYSASVQPKIQKVMKVYGNKLNIKAVHFPLSENSKLVAEASECARDQGKFWTYHNLLFERQLNHDEISLKLYAKEIGLDLDNFTKCLESGNKMKIIDEDLEFGYKNLITGTPSFIINSNQLKGDVDYSELKVAIDEEIMNEIQ